MVADFNSFSVAKLVSSLPWQREQAGVIWGTSTAPEIATRRKRRTKTGGGSCRMWWDVVACCRWGLALWDTIEHLPCVDDRMSAVDARRAFHYGRFPLSAQTAQTSGDAFCILAGAVRLPLLRKSRSGGHLSQQHQPSYLLRLSTTRLPWTIFHSGTTYTYFPHH